MGARLQTGFAVIVAVDGPAWLFSRAGPSRRQRMQTQTDKQQTRMVVPGREIVAFEHADLGYGKLKVLADLNLVLTSGDFLGIVGPNGAGKTTILKAMLGILKPIDGRVRRDAAVRFGYVPQRQFIDETYPLTALEVALMGRYRRLGVFARPGAGDRRLVRQCMDHAGIADLADRPYRELSGGQKQRTLIARALAAEPQALILDEPTNDMDIGSEHAIMELLDHFHAEEGITVVMVSHLLNVVVNYAHHLCIIDGGVRVVGRTEDVLSAEHLSEVYGVPVEVAIHRGQRVVIVRGDDGHTLA
jgi:ABC-type Mn2+/Zn2+ transport system ATPase subunit